MARVTATKSDQNGLVRSAYQKIGNWPGREKEKNMWNDLLIKLYCCSKVMMFDLHQEAH